MRNWFGDGRTPNSRRAERARQTLTTSPGLYGDIKGGSPWLVQTSSWSRIRRFYVGIVLLMIAIVIAGFWPSYFGPLFRGFAPNVPWVIHLHAVMFMGWMALLLTQVLLVSTGRTRAHRKLGTFGIGYGVLILVIGVAVSFAAPLHHLAVDGWQIDRAGDLLLSGLSDVAMFAGFFGAAIACRRRPETHKRLIVLATIALILPGAGRLVLAVFGLQPLIVLTVWLSPLLLAVGHDVLTRRRIHGAYVIGAPILLIRLPWHFVVIESEPGREFGRLLLTAFM